ncbi:MAG: RagB/SusD family nutrient uptake outer membrane protein [Bacteroidota bacterium]
MKNIIKYIALGSLLTVGMNSCKTDTEYLNPSSASEKQVTSDFNGLVALANGLQYRFSVGRQSPTYAMITANGLTTKELKVLNAGNTDEQNLQDGGASVVASNSITTNLWSQLNVIKGNSDLILNNLNNVGELGTRSGLQAYATIYKALAIGITAQFWESVSIETAPQSKFVLRTDGLKEAIRLLEAASANIAANPISANFTNRIVAGIDVPNTLNALIARYALMIGDYDKALAAAAKVDLTKKSQLNFDDLTRNPIWDVAFGNVNVFQPLDLNMGLPAALKPIDADKRIDFYFTSRALVGNTYKGKGFFKSNGDPIPMYLPSEMTLIKAEAYARKNDLVNAEKELNTILTKTTDAWGIGANLTTYAGAKTQADLLTEIYRNRRIELFMSGMSLEDSRRFARPATERSRDFYPYPQTETDNNPNTPK